MTPTAAQTALIAVLTNGPRCDAGATPSPETVTAMRAALIGYIRSLDTFTAFGILDDAVRHVYDDASQDNGDFDALECVKLTDSDIAAGWVSPSNVMETAFMKLRDWREAYPAWRAENRADYWVDHLNDASREWAA